MQPNTRKRLKTRISTAYKFLLARFGPQGWWPVTPAYSDAPLYTPKKSLTNLSESERFEICLGAFLTQNTSWTNVVRVLSLLKKKNKLKFESVLRMSRPALETFFRSSGYFRQKAFRVRKFLSVIQKETKGNFREFFDRPYGELRKKLLSLNGVGPETADSMLLYAAGKQAFVVDAYTRRIGERWGILRGGERYDDIQRLFASSLPLSNEIFSEYHALIVRLAKEFCHKKKPACLKCPTRSVCQTGKKGNRE